MTHQTRAAFLSLLLCIIAPSARAANITWNGATNSDWTIGTNWGGGVVPGGVDVVFVEIPVGPVVDAIATVPVSFLRVGNSNTGTLTIQSGGTVGSNGTIYVGTNAAGNGTITVTDAGSELESGNELRVGNSGTGTLNVENGATANAAGSLYVGTNNGADGVLNVMSGGVVFSAAQISLGQTLGATARVTINGAGSLLNSSGNINVGNGGTAELTIENAGNAEIGGNTYIGNGGTSSGIITVIGAGSKLESDGQIRIGNNGVGTLTVEDGGAIIADSVLYVGTGNGSDGTLHILSGGQVASANITSIGTNAGASGSVKVSGAGSILQSDQQIRVGFSGNGILTISDGGLADSADDIIIGEQVGSTGTLIIGAADGDAAVAAGVIDAPTITFGSGTGAIVFNHTSEDFTLSADISGAGTLDFLSGTTILSGNNNGFTGAVNLDGGILRVNGSMSALTTTVEEGARFEGNATIGNLIINDGGTLAPGNSIGTTNVVTATFNPGSIYEVEINAAMQSDLLAATGAVTINGGTVQAIPFPDFTLDTAYTIITADGGILGAGFDDVADSAFFTGSLIYNAKNVQLLLTAIPGTATSVAQTYNQQGVKRSSANVTGNTAINAMLFSSDAVSARKAMDQLSGEVHASLSAAQMREQETLRAMAMKRKPDIQANNGDTTIWAQAFGSFGETYKNRNSANVDEMSSGMIVGAERRSERGYIGGGIGHSVSRIDINARNSDANSHSYHVLAYGGGALNQSGLSLDGGASVSWHENQTDRDIRIDNFSGASRADYDAQSAQVFTRLSYRYEDIVNTNLTPYVEGAYVFHRTGDFREDGTAGLRGRKTTNGTAFTTIGFDAEHAIQFGNDGANVTLHGGLGWKRALDDGEVEQEHAWNDSANTRFTVRGAPLARDVLLVDVGFTTDPAPGVSTSISYSGSIADEADHHSLLAHAGINF